MGASFPDPRTAARLLGGKMNSKGQIFCPGPGHGRDDRSLRVTLDPHEPGGFSIHSFAEDDWKECRDYVVDKLGLDPWEPKKPNGNGAAHHSAAKPRIVREYIYRDERGTQYLKVQRTDRKDFWQRHWTGSAWEKGKPPGPKIPYRLPEMLEAIGDEVFICEGEKDADALAALGLVATSASEGAGKWTADLNRWFRYRVVYILPDNDEQGRKHAQQVAENLHGVAAEVRIVALPGLPEKGDVSDWLAAGNDPDTLPDLCRRGPVYEPDDKAEENKPEPQPGSLALTSAAFVEGYEPPDYLWDGLLQRRFVYSLTAQTGSGKTALALLFASAVALGKPLAGRETMQGRVIYCAGENPDDVRMRWIAMGDKLGIDLSTIPVTFIPGSLSLGEAMVEVKADIERQGPASLIIFDTSAAFFRGDNENDNVQAGAHARGFGAFTKLKGGPTVLVPCHPVKNASNESLEPKGGGSFINEIDGNLTLAKHGDTTVLHFYKKFRGPHFDPISFELVPVVTEKLKDSRGRLIPSVVLEAITSERQAEVAAERNRDEDDFLVALLLAGENDERLSFSQLARRLQWEAKGMPDKSKVQRIINALAQDKLVEKVRGQPVLTAKGKIEAKRARYNRDAAGATYDA